MAGPDGREGDSFLRRVDAIMVSDHEHAGQE